MRLKLIDIIVALDETAVRVAAMAFVEERSALRGGVISRKDLESFHFDGKPLKLIDQSRGIRNPRQLSATLSILSQQHGPYSDEVTPNGLIRYAYRTGSPYQGDNRKLRATVGVDLPMILLLGSSTLGAGVFVPVFPVYAINDDLEGRFVELAVDEALRFASLAKDTQDLRRYAERLVQQRLHQPLFRAEVLRAYNWSCTICRFGFRELLDAAHILGDSAGGQPVVSNGLGLCRIHHGAFDEGLLGISPDYTVHIRRDILKIKDGPMLRHGLQDLDGWALSLPKQVTERPSRAALEERFKFFLATEASSGAPS